MCPRGQNFRLWPRSIRPRLRPHAMLASFEGCPRGHDVSYRNHITYVTFFSDRKLLLAL